MQRFAICLAVLALGVAACDPTTGVVPGPFDPATGSARSELLDTATLAPFEGCDELLTHIKAEALDRVGPYGIDHMGGHRGVPLPIGDGGLPEGATTRSRPGPAVVSESFPTAADRDSGTNGPNSSVAEVQDGVVDVPDLVTFDDRHMVAVRESELNVFSLLTPTPSLLGVFDLPGNEIYGDWLFLHGNTVLAISSEFREVDASHPYASQRDPASSTLEEYVVLHEIDITNPALMRLTSTLTIDGAHLSGHMVDGVVRLVVEHDPDELGWAYPSGSDTSVAKRANRELVEHSTLDHWLPSYTLERDGHSSSGRVAPCSRVLQPSDFSGFKTTTMLTFDLSEGLNPGYGVSVLADDQMVHASTDSVFLATNEWAEPNMTRDSILAFEENYRTDLHKFSLNDLGRATYQASGSVEGHRLNSSSFSEHDGTLRMATIGGTPWRPHLSSSVNVLEQSGAVLKKIGDVADVGKGKQVWSVRFIGDLGYVVTAGRVGPLHVIDLSDPTKPNLAGELTIPEFSGFILPLDDDRLIGIGSDESFEVSLFDVSDPVDPRRTTSHTQANVRPSRWITPEEVTWSSATSDFIIPIYPSVTAVPWLENELSANGPAPRVAVLDIGPDSIRDRGIVSHPPSDNGVYRSIVHNGRLITVSWDGVATHRMSDLTELGWLPLPDRR